MSLSIVELAKVAAEAPDKFMRQMAATILAVRLQRMIELFGEPPSALVPKASDDNDDG